MELGMIGLGKMGANMTLRLLRGGHRMVVHDRDDAAMEAVSTSGAVAITSLNDLAAELRAPHAVWIMVPAGDPTEQTVARLATMLEPSDTIIDGGSSYYKDSIRRAELLRSAASTSLMLAPVAVSGA